MVNWRLRKSTAAEIIAQLGSWHIRNSLAHVEGLAYLQRVVANLPQHNIARRIQASDYRRTWVCAALTDRRRTVVRSVAFSHHQFSQIRGPPALPIRAKDSLPSSGRRPRIFSITWTAFSRAATMSSLARIALSIAAISRTLVEGTWLKTSLRLMHQTPVMNAA
jgi:hypothetical protein